jgi:hypothetical protein
MMKLAQNIVLVSFHVSVFNRRTLLVMLIDMKCAFQGSGQQAGAALRSAFNRLSLWDPFLMIYLWLQACNKEGHLCGLAWDCICNF